MITCLKTMQIEEIYVYVFNVWTMFEVWTGRPLKNYRYHGYEEGNNRGILAKWFKRRVKFNLQTI